MQKPHDNSKASPAAFMQDNTLIAVIELGRLTSCPRRFSCKKLPYNVTSSKGAIP